MTFNRPIIILGSNGLAQSLSDRQSLVQALRNVFHSNLKLRRGPRTSEEGKGEGGRKSEGSETARESRRAWYIVSRDRTGERVIVKDK